MKVDSVTAVPVASPQEKPVADEVEQDRQAVKEDALELAASEKAEKTLPSEELLSKIKELTEDGAYAVHFEMNQKLDELVVKVVDKESGDEIRQIPSEELLEMGQRLEELRGNIMDVVG